MTSIVDQSNIAANAGDVIAWKPEKNCIQIRDGRSIDVSGNEWIIETPTKRFAIHWDQLLVAEGDHRNAVRRWIAHLLRLNSPTVASGGFYQALALFNSQTFLSAALDRQTVPYLAFSEAQAGLRAEQRWQLHYPRYFYQWCVSQRFPYFDPVVSQKLDSIVIGGNLKGQAVKSADPHHGPLNAHEVATLSLALRAARIDGRMPLQEQAALWLCLAFGANASQYAMMREEDINPQIINGQLATTLVNVPRHKKGHVDQRVEFQTRRANRFVGVLLQNLVEENRRNHPTVQPDVARPLFWRTEPLNRGAGLEEWVWHLSAVQFTQLVQRAVKRLRILSRTGSPLNISTRRLRYSLATRMVQEGASKWAVAVALDHTDLQNVDTYFHVDDGIVEQLNVALATALEARAHAFAQLVEKEEDAINGNQKASRRYFGDREKEIFEPIGTCGANAFCNVIAPLGCYVCPKFQAWMEAPHNLVLDHLIEQRTRREQLGLDARMVAIEDELIGAVAGVITRIADVRRVGK